MKTIISLGVVLALICAIFTSCKKTETVIAPSSSKTKSTIHSPIFQTSGLIDNPKRVKGSIRKQSNQAVIVNATVSIFDDQDELVTTVYSDSEGAFITDSIAAGDHYALITATGYQQKRVDFTLNEDHTDHDLGDIYLQE